MFSGQSWGSQPPRPRPGSTRPGQRQKSARKKEKEKRNTLEQGGVWGQPSRKEQLGRLCLSAGPLGRGAPAAPAKAWTSREGRWALPGWGDARGRGAGGARHTSSPFLADSLPSCFWVAREGLGEWGPQAGDPTGEETPVGAAGVRLRGWAPDPEEEGIARPVAGGGPESSPPVRWGQARAAESPGAALLCRACGARGEVALQDSGIPAPESCGNEHVGRNFKSVFQEATAKIKIKNNINN